MFRSNDRNTISHKARLVALLASTALVGANPAFAQSLPTGGSVAAGSATIGTPSNGTLTINQTSANAVVNWQNFNIGQGNGVTFVQPNTSSAILNRVTGSTTTTIAGSLTANGQVYLVNPNGIAITPTGTINTGAFVASTLGISDNDFMAGKRTFTGNGASGSVTNAGTITINRGGYLALIGGSVENSGVITVPMGKAALGSGEQATLDLAGDGFLQVAIPTSATGTKALVSNSGKISANGGTVQLSAAAARDMARQAVNMSGTIEAKGVSGRSGDITLTGGGGEAAVSGTLDASNATGTGGKLTVTGRSIKLASARVNASGKTGGGTVNIGGERQGGGTLKHAETLTVDTGTIIDADAITSGNGGNVVLWSDNLTSFAGTITARGGSLFGNGGEAEVSGKALLSYTGLTDLTAAHGSFGNLLLDPYNVTISSGTDSNTDGSFNATGNDSVINVNTLTNALATANVTVTTGSSSDATNPQAGTITVSAPVAWNALTTLTLAAASDININSAITANGGLIVSSGGTISAPAAVNVGAFVLASGNWVQNSATLPAFSAKDFRITDGTSFLRVTGGDGTSATPYLLTDVYGLQGIGSSSSYLAAQWSLANDIDASGTATWNNGAGFAPIGTESAAFTGSFDGGGNGISGLTINRPSTDNVGLFGYLNGGATISNVGLIGGTVSGRDEVGGLVGYGANSTINNVYTTGAVNGRNEVGGLVGENGSTITNAYVTGAVRGSGNEVGGLAGFSWGSIENAYATGAVSGNFEIGGLVGTGYGPITNAYASGAVTGTGAGPSFLGGLVGMNTYYSDVTNSFWDAGTTGQSSGYGLNIGSFSAVGLTTAQARNASSYTDWDFSNTWFQSGDMRPILRSEGAAADANGVVTISNLHQLALMGANLAGSYKLASDLDASATSGTNAADIWSTSGWVPVGDYNAAFTGNFDGQGHTIAGLTVNRGASFLGLFGNSSGTIQNIGLISEFINGYSYTGGLVGYNTGTISNAYTTGTVNGSQDVGGLVGYNSGSISNTYATAAVSGGYEVGGLVGYNHGSISNSYATGTTYGSGSDAGGLAGFNDRTINFAYATGSVTGNTYVGGLVGYNDSGSSIDNAYASGAVNGSVAVGGLVGRNYFSTITNSFWDVSTTGRSSGYGQSFSGTFSATGLTTAQMRDSANNATNYAGWDFANTWYQTSDMRPILRSEAATADSNGVIAINNVHQLALIGVNLTGNYTLANNIDASETSGTNASGIWSTGGLAPLGNINTEFRGNFNGNNHTISALTVTGYDQVGLFAVSAGSISNVGLVGGSVTGVRSDVGALAGWNYGSISNSYSTATVSGSFDVGGLVAMNFGTISSSYATGAVSGNSAFIGGLVGYNSGAIIDSYATGAVGGGAVGMGGLVGNNSDRGGTIIGSYATGSVSGGSRAGGLAGDNGGTITNSYASGAVSGSDTVGGLVGGNYAAATISNSYAIGAVTGGGGLTGENDGTVTASFWDTETTGQASGTSSGAATGMTGLTTAQMADPFNFIDAGWDFATVWGKSTSGANGGYMMLRALSTGLYDDYVSIDSGTRTYGDANAAISGATLSGVGTGNVSFAWGSAIGATTNAGTYNYSEADIVSVTETGSRTAYVDYSGALTISQRVLNLTGGRVYDGSTDVAAANLSLGNFANGETLTLTGAGSMADKNAGTGKALSLGTLSLGDGTGLASNYVLSIGTVDITRATVSGILGITADNKTYDGGTDAALNTLGAGFTGMVAGDALTVATSSGAFSDKNVGTGKAVSITGLSLGGADAGNYTLASDTAATTADITRATISAITGITADNKTYDGSTSATLNTSGASFTGMVANDVLTVATSAGAFSDKNAGTGKTVTMSGLSLGGADADNYTLASNTATTTANIAKATISAITGITADNKTYDGSTSATLETSGAGFTGMIAGDALTVATSAGAFADKNAGAGKTVGITGLSLGGTDAGNYTLASNTAMTSADIAKATLSLTGITADSKTYDGSTVATVSGAGSLNGVVTHDDVSFGYSGATFSDHNVGSSKAVTLSGVILSGADASNYTIAPTATTTADIVQRAITVTADGISKTYGDANPAMTYSTSGLVNGDTLSGSLSTSAGQYSNVGSYGITQGTLANANYAITYNAANLTITPRALTVTADALSRAYGDVNPTLSYTAVGLVNNDTLSGSLSTSAGQYSNVGAYGITQGTLADANYAITYNAANLTITPRALTVTADALSKTYGDANPALNYTTSGLVENDTLSGSLSTSAGQYSNVGAYGITQGTLANANYAITYNAANLTITPRALTVTADALSKTYGDANPAMTYSASGLVNGDTLSGSLSTSAGQYSNVGAYAISQGTLANANYAITYNAANLTITPRALTVTADALSRAYGDANPAMTYSTSGLVNGDTLSGSLSTSAGQYSNVGSYGITQGTLADANYAITYNAANLTITPRALTVTADALSRAYGDVNPTLSYTAVGLVNNDTLSGSLSTSAGQYSNVGTYGITQGTLADANYAITYNAANLTINPRALTVTADALSKTYGDANPAMTYSASGLVNGDTLSGSLSTSAGQYSNVGSYAITGSFSASSNYALTYVGANLSVNQRAITVTADALSKTYGDANPALTYTIGGAGLVNGDTLSGSLSTTAGQYSNVGAYAIDQGTLAASSNYALAYAGANLSVNQRALTVTADAKSKTYGDANPTLSYTATGLVHGDMLSGSLSTTAGQYANVGAYAITQGSLANANYAISYTGADLTINQRAITVAAESLSRRFGLANPALAYTVAGAGLVNGDRLSGGLATSATSLSEPGAYAITQGTLLASANYRMSFLPGVLTVEMAADPEPGTQASSVTPTFDAGRFAPIRPVSDDAETADDSRDLITDPRFRGTFVCLANGNGCVSLPTQATP